MTSDCAVDVNVPMSLVSGIKNEINEIYRINTEDEQTSLIRDAARQMRFGPTRGGTQGTS